MHFVLYICNVVEYVRLGEPEVPPRRFLYLIEKRYDCEI